MSTLKFCPGCLKRIWHKNPANFPICNDCVHDLARLDDAERMKLTIEIFKAVQASENKITFDLFAERIAEAIIGRINSTNPSDN